ncbi:hypothetical protein [uncultured Mediterranean phage]|nr:hypothetical protein [uncultured Mediterranean phage]
MATSFKVKFSKNKAQSTITVTRDDNVNISGMTSCNARVYSDDLATADNTYTFTAQDIIDLKAGTVDITTLSLIGSASPVDDYYTIILDGDTATYVSDSAGVAITLEAMYEVLRRSGYVDVYSPDYRKDRVLLTGFTMLYMMDNIEEQDPSKQKRVDYTTRQDSLQKMFNYS